MEGLRRGERERDARKVEKDMRGGDAPSSYYLSRRHVRPFLPKVSASHERPVLPVRNGVMVALVGFFLDLHQQKISFLDKKNGQKILRL